jgi:hypothetical protein
MPLFALRTTSGTHRKRKARYTFPPVGILDDIEAGANWIAQALESSGYKADFSPQSAWELDRFFDDHLDGPGQPSRGGLLAEDLGSRLFALGSYLGEVVRRNAEGWGWHGDDTDPEAEINVELRNESGTTIWPVQRVMKRYSQGQEEAIAPYVQTIAEVPVGEPPARPKRRGFRRR